MVCLLVASPPSPLLGLCRSQQLGSGVSFGEGGGGIQEKRTSWQGWVEGVALQRIWLLGSQVIPGGLSILAALTGYSWGVRESDSALRSWPDQSQGPAPLCTVWALERATPGQLPLACFNFPHSIL